MQNGTAPPANRPQRAGMTIRVYTVDRHGTVTGDRGTVSVPYPEERIVPLTDGYPPCACPRCRSVSPAVDTSSATTTAPVDIATMRETVRALLLADGASVTPPPSGARLETLTATLRGHLELLIPEVEQAVGRLDKQSSARHCALACLGDARLRLRDEPTTRYHGPIGHARRLARALNALCEHYEQLSGSPT
ncbi:DUF6415 family natural product biosynthesis protein [Streptomyces sp. NPDC088812]|uniref:DUF6415 family natural product biosynthesis protein n=1 Tax=Streptomyces sp. NPDC088812 TaxID=3365905 RepID=UPI0038105407